MFLRSLKIRKAGSIFGKQLDKGVKMIGKVRAFSLIVTICVFLFSCSDGGKSTQELLNLPVSGWKPGTSDPGPVYRVAGQLESAADKLYSHPVAKFKQISASDEIDAKSCDKDNSAEITVYSTNGMAQSEIEVTLDGVRIGSLKTFYPNDEPGCKTPSADGVITLVVPAGEHTLEATSSNVNWPSHTFTLEKCGCMVLPLS